MKAKNRRAMSMKAKNSQAWIHWYQAWTVWNPTRERISLHKMCILYLQTRGIMHTPAKWMYSAACHTSQLTNKIALPTATCTLSVALANRSNNRRIAISTSTNCLAKIAISIDVASRGSYVHVQGQAQVGPSFHLFTNCAAYNDVCASFFGSA